MLIKELSFNNRPRERLINNGVESLSDYELISIILQSGTKGENVITVSQNLLSKYNIDKLSNCSLKELQQIKGIGVAKACQIISAFELSKRGNNSKVKLKQIKSAKDVFDYCKSNMSNLDRERFVVLFLDTKNKIIKEEVVSIGTLNSSLIHPREVFKGAIKNSANSVIFVHNHPSGDPTPSDEDKEITKQLFDIGNMLEIKVLDHVIIGKDDYYSFK
jgi:DNA repair protein RadC